MLLKKTFLRYVKWAVIMPVVLLVLGQFSCKKWLDKKPKQDLAVPSTLADLQAVLDNETFSGASPGDLEFVADNYYLTDTSWNTAAPVLRSSYIWAADAQVTSPEVWSAPYFGIYEANFVLDQLPGIEINESNKSAYNNVKGTALFYRSFLFYQLAQLFCKPYSTQTANNDPGIVLRLTSNVTAATTRASVQETYTQVINDMKTAVALLPVTSVFVTRPNIAAAYGILARIYLSMRDYTNAGKYADSCLQVYNVLLNYNTLNLSIPAAESPFPTLQNNPEILYYSGEAAPADLLQSHKELIDSFLYQSYDVNDLRKTAFFGANAGAGTYFWRGSYFKVISASSIFDGITTAEVYLILAECKAKNGDVAGAMVALNTLMRNRKTSPYTDITAVNSTDALQKIRRERRKELVFRGLRWSDLRRYNLEDSTITLKRNINQHLYTLPPLDPRWVLLIPDVEIRRSGILQNPR